jgi:hypothetical protein
MPAEGSFRWRACRRPCTRRPLPSRPPSSLRLIPASPGPCSVPSALHHHDFKVALYPFHPANSPSGMGCRG